VERSFAATGSIQLSVRSAWVARGGEAEGRKQDREWVRVRKGVSHRSTCVNQMKNAAPGQQFLE